MPRFARLYATHREWVEKAARALEPHTEALSTKALSTKCQLGYKRRLTVPVDMVPWSVDWPAYKPREFTDESVSDGFKAKRNWADPDTPFPKEFITKLHENRDTFEGDITFDQHDRPRNPRGRTGIVGRGRLGKWGPNHQAHAIVTRKVPRKKSDGTEADAIEVIVIHRADTREWSLPGGMVQVGEDRFATVRRKFVEEALECVEPTEHLEREGLLDELFASSNGREIYCGYVDDPRNTDNAWVETTAVHFHCSPRVAKRLRLNTRFGAVKWYDIASCDEIDFYASHKDWVELTKRRLEQREKHRQLLRLVVSCGRRDTVESVLTDPSLTQQRQQQVVQAAFGDALILATKPHFEVGVVDLLLDNGARAENVVLDELFKARGDRFGYLKAIEQGYSNKEHSATSRCGNWYLMPSIHCILRCVGKHSSRGLKRESFKLCQPEHARFLSSLVPGFKHYAETREKPCNMDIMFWALACGAFDLAFTLWCRCESPLRAALLAQHVCRFVRKEKRRHVKQLQELEARFCNAAHEVLDEIDDEETARQVLQSYSSDFAILGQAGQRITLIELAIELDNKEFISHRYCQGIIDQMWLGRASEGGRVQLAPPHEPWRLFLQVLIPFVCIVKLKRNDLFHAHEFTGRGEKNVTPYDHPNSLQSFSGFWHIPAVKRIVHLLSLTTFAILTVVIVLMPACGPLGVTHVIWLVYVAAYLLMVVHQIMLNYRLWRRSTYNILEAIVLVLLTLSASLRAFMASQTQEDALRYSPASDLIDWANQQRSAEAPLRPGWPWFTDHIEAHYLADSAHFCGWTPVLEAYRTILAVAMVLFALRMLEWFTNNLEMGVLVVIIIRMIRNVSDWMPILLTITTGFAIAMSIVMPRFKIGDAELGVYPFVELDLDISVGGPFMAPFWGIFGFFEPADIARAEGSAFLTPLLFWLYLLIALVLMTNLLIAMFNDTYVAVKDKSDEEFMMSRALKLKGYVALYAVPAPFNVLAWMWDRVRSRLRKKTTMARDANASSSHDSVKGLAYISETLARDRYLNGIRAHETEQRSVAFAF